MDSAGSRDAKVSFTLWWWIDSAYPSSSRVDPDLLRQRDCPAPRLRRLNGSDECFERLRMHDCNRPGQCHELFAAGVGLSPATEDQIDTGGEAGTGGGVAGNLDDAEGLHVGLLR